MIETIGLWILDHAEKFFGWGMSRRRERIALRDELESIKLRALLTDPVNHIHEAVEEIGSFFRRHPSLLQIDANRGFLQSWVMNPYLRFAGSAAGFWTNEQLQRFRADVGALQI
jgi:hypothetical protein